jgi:hypothetical protein
MKDDSLDNLFAAARRAPTGEPEPIPSGFAERIVLQHQKNHRENQTFFRTSILSIGTAFVILGALLGYNFEMLGYSGTDDQDSMIDLPSALWDPAGN